MSEEPIEGDERGENGEDDRDYTPDFIKSRLANPPLLPNESQREFEAIFESYEFACDGRPKTDAEYLLVYQATTVTWDMMRLERMKVKILTYQGRFAAESLYRKSHEHLGIEGDPKEVAGSARKWVQHYFAHPEYRKVYAAKLEAAGYGAGAVEAEAFLRSLYPLGQIDRLISALERRLLNILKRLDSRYESRATEMQMPKSPAASRADKS